MKNEVVPVQIRGLLPTNSGCAIFVGNDQKVFVIQVEHNLGMIIQMFLQEKTKERPLTHDLIVNVFKGFSISLERVIITELKNSTYFARLILKQDNELGKKLVEIDAAVTRIAGSSVPSIRQLDVARGSLRRLRQGLGAREDRLMPVAAPADKRFRRAHVKPARRRGWRDARGRFRAGASCLAAP